MPVRSLQVVGLGDNVEAVEDAPSLVAAPGHRHPLRNTCPDHIPDGRPAEVVEQLPLDAGFAAGRMPGPSEGPDRLSAPEEDPRARRVSPISDLPLPLEQVQQLPGQVDHPGLPVLRGPGLEPPRAAVEIHLVPRQAHRLRIAPTGVVGEGRFFGSYPSRPSALT